MTAKDVRIGVRIAKKDHDMIQCLVEEGQYINLSQFVRFAIKSIIKTHLKIMFTSEGVTFE